MQVWAVGGWSRTGLEPIKLAEVEVYNPQVNMWRPGVPLPRPCVDGACTVVQG